MGWKLGLPSKFPCIVYLPSLKVFNQMLYLETDEEMDEETMEEISHWIPARPDEEEIRIWRLENGRSNN